MKKLILSIAVSFILTNAIGQIITAREMLEKAKCKNFQCFNEFITSKGLTIFTVDGNGTSYTYNRRLNAVIPEAHEVAFSSIFLTNEYKIFQVMYCVNSFSYYSELKEEFLNQGFTYVKEDSGEDNQEGIDYDNKYIYTQYGSSRYPGLALKIYTNSTTKKGKSNVSYSFNFSFD